MIDKDFDPLKMLNEMAHEVVRLGERQIQTEAMLRELAQQHERLTRHIADQAAQIHEIKQTTKTDS